MSKVLLIFDHYKELNIVENILKKVGFTVLGLSTEYGIKEQILSFNPEVIVGYGTGVKFSSVSISKKLKELPRWQGKAVFIFPENFDISPEDLMGMRMDLMLRTPVPPIRLLSVLARLFNRDENTLLEKLKNLQSASMKGHTQTLESKSRAKGASSGSQRVSGQLGGNVRDLSDDKIEVKGKISNPVNLNKSSGRIRKDGASSNEAQSSLDSEADLDPFTREINRAIRGAAFGDGQNSEFGVGSEAEHNSEIIMDSNAKESDTELLRDHSETDSQFFSESEGEEIEGREDEDLIDPFSAIGQFSSSSDYTSTSASQTANISPSSSPLSSSSSTSSSQGSPEGLEEANFNLNTMGSPYNSLNQGPISVGSDQNEIHQPFASRESSQPMHRNGELGDGGEDSISSTGSFTGEGSTAASVTSDPFANPQLSSAKTDIQVPLPLRRDNLIGDMSDQLAHHDAILKARIQKYSSMVEGMKLNPVSSLHRVDTRRVQKELVKEWGFEDLYDQDELRRQFVESLFRKKV